MDEITLSNGTMVRVEPIPFVMGFDLANKIPALRYPEEPMIEVKIMKGKSTETVAAPKDSKEWQEYETDRKTIDELRSSFNQYLPWQEGVIEWQLAGTDEWTGNVPADYKLPRVLEQAGGFAPFLDNLRIAYIRYVVCHTMNDVLVLTNALLSGMALTEPEVESAVEGFPGTSPRTGDAQTPE